MSLLVGCLTGTVPGVSGLGRHLMRTGQVSLFLYSSVVLPHSKYVVIHKENQSVPPLFVVSCKLNRLRVSVDGGEWENAGKQI